MTTENCKYSFDEINAMRDILKYGPARNYALRTLQIIRFSAKYKIGKKVGNGLTQFDLDEVKNIEAILAASETNMS